MIADRYAKRDYAKFSRSRSVFHHSITRTLLFSNVDSASLLLEGTKTSREEVGEETHR